jgi:hypothetical protein
LNGVVQHLTYPLHKVISQTILLLAKQLINFDLDFLLQLRESILELSSFFESILNLLLVVIKRRARLKISFIHIGKFFASCLPLSLQINHHFPQLV